MYSISYVWISVLCADVSLPHISRGVLRIPTRVHPGGNAERTLANVPDWKRLEMIGNDWVVYSRFSTIENYWNNFDTIENNSKRLSYRSKSIVSNRVLSIFSRRVNSAVSIKHEYNFAPYRLSSSRTVHRIDWALAQLCTTATIILPIFPNFCRSHFVCTINVLILKFMLGSQKYLFIQVA